MNQNLVALAFAAGMVAALNPCGFAMLPAYLTFVVTGAGEGKLQALGRALAATVAMALGFLTVFGIFGLLTVSVASLVQRYLPYVTVLVGISLVALGVWLLSGRELAIRPAAGGARLAPTARLGSMYGYGIGYAIASLSCTVGPFLAVTGSSLGAGSAVATLSVYAAYIAGLTLVVGVLAGAVALASSALIERLRGFLPYVSRGSGGILVAVGLYVAYYGSFEVRLFGSTTAVRDPVIAAAGRVQGTLAGWVYSHGPLPWLVLAVGLGAAAALTGLRRRRRTAAGGPSAALDSGS